MGCYECARLAALFAEAISKHASVRQKNIAALTHDTIAARRMERELELSTVELNNLRAQLLNHEASHNNTTPKPRNEESHRLEHRDRTRQ